MLTYPQNLIPLILIRPLRIVLSAEQLRSTRIVLLKATHLPIVGAIWLFEFAHAKLKGDHQTFSAIGPASGHGTDSTMPPPPPKRQRPFLSNRSSSKISSQHFPDVPDEDGAHSPGLHGYNLKGKQEAERTIVVQNTDLEDRVNELSNKIAELTALIMAQQGTTNEE